MKRSELSVGLEVADKQGFRGTVEHVEPWVQPRQYMGRFGYMDKGEPRPKNDRDGNSSGVLVRVSGRGLLQSDERLEVWSLAKMEPASQADEREQQEREVKEQKRAVVDKALALLDSLGVRGFAYYDRNRGIGSVTNKVVVGAADLVELLEQAMQEPLVASS